MNMSDHLTREGIQLLINYCCNSYEAGRKDPENITELDYALGEYGRISYNCIDYLIFLIYMFDKDDSGVYQEPFMFPPIDCDALFSALRKYSVGEQKVFVCTSRHSDKGCVEQVSSVIPAASLPAWKNSEIIGIQSADSDTEMTSLAFNPETSDYWFYSSAFESRESPREGTGENCRENLVELFENFLVPDLNRAEIEAKYFINRIV